MKLPEIADRLRELSTIHGLPELNDLADEMRRRSGSRAPNSSRPMTPALAAQIRSYAAAHPSMTQIDIGRRFGVDQGRVSEVLRGFRT